jgi:integrase/recombinase XerC
VVSDVEAFVRRQQRRWGPRTRRPYTRDLTRRLNKVLGFLLTQGAATSWNDFRLGQAEAFIDHELARGLKPQSVNADLTILRSLFGFLESEGRIGRSPFHQLPQVEPGQRVPRFLTDVEVARLEHDLHTQVEQATCPEDRRSARFDLAWFYLLYHAGLRLSEACYLELDDLDLAGRRVMVRSGKGLKDRVVPLSTKCAQAVQAYLEVRGPAVTSQLWVLRHRAATTHGLRERILNLAARTGIAVRAHRLRHTIATQLINAEMPVTSLQRLLGHEDLDKTMIYAQVADQTLVRDYTQGMQRIEQAQPPADLKVSLLPVRSDRQHVLELLQQLAQPELTVEQRIAAVLEMQSLLPKAMPIPSESTTRITQGQVG